MSDPAGAIERPRPRISPVVVDALIAFGLAGMSLVPVFGGAPDVGSRQPLSIALLLMESLPLVFRRRWPVTVLAVTLSATIAHAWMAPADSSLNEGLGVLVAVFTVAERRDRRTSVISTLVVMVAFGSVILIRGGLPRALGGFIQSELVVVLSWAFGDLVRTRALYAGVLEDRARLLEDRARRHEAEREERARGAVAAERERIARELHDVVTHHVSVIVIQAGAALRAIERRPESARVALEAIDRTGREALADMRRMLGILGAGDEPALDTVPGALRPQPGLDRLGDLVEQVRAAGVPVELSLEGERRPLDAGVELSAYRIIQEALTNVLKHARGARARVDLRYGPRTLDITVTDEGGRGRHDLGEPVHEGRGLIGMSERAAVFGGSLHAGPTPTGFQVRASLPIEIAGGTAA